MSKLKWLFLLAVGLLLTHCGDKKNIPKTTADRLDSLFATIPDFSGVVLVADHGHPVYYKAFGYRDFESKIPMDTAAVFELASVSKQFTAMIIMMLMEEGKLSYDDPIEKYLQGIPYPGITIRHLLTHTSGLPDYLKLMDEHWDKTRVAGNDDILENLIKYRPERLFAPGDQYAYSNTGYVLLASIAEKATGEDFIELCRHRIFKPLQMSATDIRNAREKKLLKDFAIGHQYSEDEKKWVNTESFPSSNYTLWLGGRKGPGRISSTASDLLKWDKALYTEKLVRKETLEEAFTPFRLKNDSLSNYGFGWVINNKEPHERVVSHTGDNPGYKTEIIRAIDQHKTFIRLCNKSEKAIYLHGINKFFGKLLDEDLVRAE